MRRAPLLFLPLVLLVPLVLSDPEVCRVRPGIGPSPWCVPLRSSRPSRPRPFGRPLPPLLLGRPRAICPFASLPPLGWTAASVSAAVGRPDFAPSFALPPLPSCPSSAFLSPPASGKQENCRERHVLRRSGHLAGTDFMIARRPTPDARRPTPGARLPTPGTPLALAARCFACRVGETGRLSRAPSHAAARPHGRNRFHDCPTPVTTRYRHPPSGDPPRVWSRARHRATPVGATPSSVGGSGRLLNRSARQSLPLGGVQQYS
jgi:hypothetical protein